ncbi:MAG: hypothetical protein K8963_01160, partial [Proteobacteria bacterium]|nr:hypothetical protein [Pseudomonadota bacterium]
PRCGCGTSTISISTILRLKSASHFVLAGIIDPPNSGTKWPAIARADGLCSDCLATGAGRQKYVVSVYYC